MSNEEVVCFSDACFDYELGRTKKELKDFNVRQNGAVMTKCNVNTVTVDIQQIAILGMFAEHGCVTGQMYQCNANHRRLQWTSFLQRTWDGSTGWTPPLLQSMVCKSESTGFSDNALICIGFYEVEVVDDNVEVDIGAQLQANGSVAIAKDGEIDNCIAFMKRRQCKAATFEGVSRFLDFFGRKWMVKKRAATAQSAVLDVHLFAELAAMFSNDKISSVSEFKKFLKKYKLGRIYEYIESEPLEVNWRRFQQLYRALCPLRLQFLDGQHRGVLTHLISNGIF